MLADKGDFQTRTAVTFRHWIGQRKIASVGTTAGLEAPAFQRWRTFKEAFAPEIVERAILESHLEVRHIIDPFGGSGTTAIAAQFLGAKPTIIEVNPYLADLIECKVAHYDLDQVGIAFASICRDARRLNPTPAFPGAPKTLVEPGVKGRYIFSKEVASRIISYRQAIDNISSTQIRRLFRVLLGSILIPVSNVVISGKGRRYRRSWQDRELHAVRVDEMFQQLALNAIHDLKLYAARACRDYQVLRGDCRNLLDAAPRADLAVFSPPYPNSFDYTDVYNVELWTLGYLDSSEANLSLRKATLRSHVQIKRDMSGTHYRSKKLAMTIRALDSARKHLWNLQIPEMISAYISDMGDVMAKLSANLRDGARVYMVVGDSRYAGVYIPIAEILEEIANSTGFSFLTSEACRSMRASPQQGGNEELAETLIVLKK